MDHAPLIQLVVGWTFAGVVVCTAITTFLSLFGLVRFANPDQQRKLFAVFVVEIMVGGVGYFVDLLRLDVRHVEAEIVEEATERALEEGDRQLRVALHADLAALESVYRWLVRRAHRDPGARSQMVQLDGLAQSTFEEGPDRWLFNPGTRVLSVSSGRPVRENEVVNFGGLVMSASLLADSVDSLEAALQVAEAGNKVALNRDGNGMGTVGADSIRGYLVESTASLEKLQGEIGRSESVRDAVERFVSALRGRE